MNEPYRLPPMPKQKGIRAAIIKGMYKFHATKSQKKKAKAHLLGSGTILNEALKAQAMLEKDYDLAADVWSVTSYKELYQDAVECERWNLLNPKKRSKITYVRSLLAKEKGVFVAVSDYMKVLLSSVAQWFPGPLHCLGIDGFGRRDSREKLRDFFEVDARYIALAALKQLEDTDAIAEGTVAKAILDLEINFDKLNPHID